MGLTQNTISTIYQFLRNNNILLGSRKRPMNTRIADSSGSQAFVFPFGELLSAKKHDDIRVSFQYDYLDEQFDVKIITPVGTGTTGVTDSLAYAQGLTGGDLASFQSKDAIRYLTGHSGYADFTASFEGVGIGYAGMGDNDKDSGFALKYNNGVVSFGYFRNTVELGSLGAAGFDLESTWNGFEKPTIDWTKVNIFRIVFGYLGVASPSLWIKKNGRYYHLHTVETEGLLTTTHVTTPVFPIFIEAQGEMIVKTGSWNGGVIGNGTSIGNRNFMFPNTLLVSGASHKGEATLAGTTTKTIVIFRSKTSFKTKINHIKARLTGYEFFVDAPSGSVNGVVIFQIVGVQTLSGAATYTSINNNSSVMEYDYTNYTGASVSVTAGVPIIQQSLAYASANKGGAVSSGEIDAEQLGAFAYGGDVFGVIAQDLNGKNVKVRVKLNWEELQ